MEWLFSNLHKPRIFSKRRVGYFVEHQLLEKSKIDPIFFQIFWRLFVYELWKTNYMFVRVWGETYTFKVQYVTLLTDDYRHIMSPGVLAVVALVRKWLFPTGLILTNFTTKKCKFVSYCAPWDPSFQMLPHTQCLENWV